MLAPVMVVSLAVLVYFARWRWRLGAGSVFGLVVLLSRSIVDLGSASSGNVLPSLQLSAAIGVLSVLACTWMVFFDRNWLKLSWFAVPIAGIVFGTFVGIYNFGIELPLIQESFRLISILAITAIAGIAAKIESKDSLQSLILSSICFPGCALLLGAFLGFKEMTQAGGRAAGTFSHPNAAGAFFALGCLLSLHYVVYERKKFAFIVSIISLSAVVLSQSLGSLIGVLLGFTVAILFSPALSTARKWFLSFVAMSVSVSLLSFTSLSGRISGQPGSLPTFSLNGDAGDSLQWRLLNWSLLLSKLKESPLLGFGLGTTTNFIEPLGGPPHSMPIQITLETGLCGFICFCLLIGLFVVRVYRSNHIDSKNKALLLGIIVFAAVNGAESNLMDYTATDYLIAFAVGVSTAGQKPTNGALDFESPAKIRII